MTRLLLFVKKSDLPYTLCWQLSSVNIESRNLSYGDTNKNIPLKVIHEKYNNSNCFCFTSYVNAIVPERLQSSQLLKVVTCFSILLHKNWRNLNDNLLLPSARKPCVLMWTEPRFGKRKPYVLKCRSRLCVHYTNTKTVSVLKVISNPKIRPKILPSCGMFPFLSSFLWHLT